MLNIFKVLNVGVNQTFKINSLAGTYYIAENGAIYQRSSDGYIADGDEAKGFVYRRAINSGITPIEQPTKEQIRLLESLFYLGYRYLAKDKDGVFWVFERMPVYVRGDWESDWENERSGDGSIVDRDMPQEMVDTLINLVDNSECLAIKELLEQGDVSDGTN